MPLQIAPVPYRGDQYLAQGISSAGQNIAEGIEGMTKRLRQTKAMRTMAVDGMGMDPDKVDNMTPEQIQGIMQGMAVKNAQAEAQARRQMEQAHANYFNRFNQKADAEDRFSSAVSDYMRPPLPNTGNPIQQPPTGDLGRDLMSAPDPTGVLQRMTQPRTLDPQTLMRLEAQAGTLDPDKAMQYMKQLSGGPAQTPTMFDEDPVTGTRFARHNGSIMPSGMDPKMVSSGPQTSADDNFFFDGKKWNALKGKEMTDSDRGKLQVTHQKLIDELVKAKFTAKSYGDVTPEDEAEINDRIAMHKKAVAALDAQATGTGAASGPKAGDVIKGYRFKGGNPADRNNWAKAN